MDMAAQHRDARACTLLTLQDINHDIPPAHDLQEMKMASCGAVGHGQGQPSKSFTAQTAIVGYCVLVSQREVGLAMEA